MQIELTVEQEDAVAKYWLRETVKFLASTTERERIKDYPDWEQVMKACKVVLKFYGD